MVATESISQRCISSGDGSNLASCSRGVYESIPSHPITPNGVKETPENPAVQRRPPKKERKLNSPGENNRQAGQGHKSIASHNKSRVKQIHFKNYVKNTELLVGDPLLQQSGNQEAAIIELYPVLLYFHQLKLADLLAGFPLFQQAGNPGSQIRGVHAVPVQVCSGKGRPGGALPIPPACPDPRRRRR